MAPLQNILLLALLCRLSTAQTTSPASSSQNLSQSPTATSASCPVSPSPGYLFPNLPVNPTTPGSCQDALQKADVANSPSPQIRSQNYKDCVQKCNTQQDFCNANYRPKCAQTYAECLGATPPEQPGCMPQFYASLESSAEAARTNTGSEGSSGMTSRTTASEITSSVGVTGSSGAPTITTAATVSSSTPSSTTAAAGSWGTRARVPPGFGPPLYIAAVFGTTALLV